MLASSGVTLSLAAQGIITALHVFTRWGGDMVTSQLLQPKILEDGRGSYGQKGRIAGIQGMTTTKQRESHEVVVQ